LHGDAFALNSFLAIRPHPHVMACLPFKDGRPQGWGELMPDVTFRFIWAIERGKTNKFL
jgi:hypothetical protein